jgi:hypothetical protein
MRVLPRLQSGATGECDAYAVEQESRQEFESLDGAAGEIRQNREKASEFIE